MANEKRASLRTSDFVDALPMAIDGKFAWKEPRFAIFEYKKKTGELVATTTAARVTYVSEETGEEFVQHYSAGDPKRVVPSEDGKSLVPKGDSVALNKSSNFFMLMKALEDAGLPEDFMDNDFSVLEGMVTHNIGIQEPKRVGLDRPEPAEGGRIRVFPVPDEIVSMPGKGKKAAAGKKAAEAPSDEDVVAEAVVLIAEAMEANPDGVAKKDVAAAAIKAKKAPVATATFKLTAEQLAPYGYTLDGDKIIPAG
jgi:hypothetical protein